ncbi:hypothetical protein BS50DRAFT_160391 [Corynespora cassiicola Philippines]|uniref:Uncharacterized protein n=1 Tax=Corynespora cassiicola Philippines TaxID=1448308 RepID=A0A2T2N669_CORCC|nr:hypothetical protein BS50DRAFT_160391 [Corynespora cassiicola Philippines]
MCMQACFMPERAVGDAMAIQARHGRALAGTRKRRGDGAARGESEAGMRNAGCWMLDARRWIWRLDTGHWMLEAQRSTLDGGFWDSRARRESSGALGGLV